MNWLEIFIGQLPEAIYFAIFMIFTKGIQKNKLKFVTLMTCEYILLMNSIPYSIWTHVLYFVVTYMILKLLYKDLCQITDIFTLTIGGLILILSSAVVLPLYLAGLPYIWYVVINRLILFMLLFFITPILPKLEETYKKIWNRNDKIKKPIKTTTFRCMNIVIFDIMFCLINIGILLYIMYK